MLSRFCSFNEFVDFHGTLLRKGNRFLFTVGLLIGHTLFHPSLMFSYHFGKSSSSSFAICRVSVQLAIKCPASLSSISSKVFADPPSVRLTFVITSNGIW